jgi:acetyl esterase/lipase
MKSESQVIELWPEGVPNSLPNAPAEHEAAGRVYNVSRPSLSVYPAPSAIATGTAAIVCPGGGYTRLAMAKEGAGLTHWLNQLGVTVFLLKYRTAPFRYPAQLQDVLRALRLAIWGACRELRWVPFRHDATSQTNRHRAI